MDYGDSRIKNVYRRWNPNSFETTLIAAHLPKTMCREIPDYYPIVDKQTAQPVIDTATGEPRMRSRWVAKDRNEAIRYFTEVLTYYTREVLTGGADAIHGFDINFDESTPHIQIMADTLAPDPKHEGKLRVDAARMWGAHRDVTVDKIDKVTGHPVIDEKTGQPQQVMEQPKAKMSRYQQGLRAHMINRGFPVESDYDPERHLSGLGKDEYAEVMDTRRQTLDQTEQLKVKNEDLKQREASAEDYHARLDTYRDNLTKEDKWLRYACDQVDQEKSRVASRSRDLDDREADITHRDQHAAEKLSKASAELEAAARARAAAKRHQETLEEREERVTAREAIVKDVNDFLDRMKTPAKETLREHFETFMHTREKKRQRIKDKYRADAKARTHQGERSEPDRGGPVLGG
ncbi:hypothetical protein [Nesterenkonia natronophila]|uniref:hypothetical protein n=1 Tax=Nesterenkonia natronophila TaxID=2174932 RepID=UPI0011C4116B|nr:hypothetical protein [Nesterenkonia natronophila]